MEQSRENRLFNRLGIFLAPPNVEGQLELVWEPIDPLADRRSVWTFQPLVRRVQRVPSLDPDDPDPRTQGLRTADQYDGWNGSPGAVRLEAACKREMYIPYNSYKFADKQLKYVDILKPGYVPADLLRYELHRASPCHRVPHHRRGPRQGIVHHGADRLGVELLGGQGWSRRRPGRRC